MERRHLLLAAVLVIALLQISTADSHGHHGHHHHGHGHHHDHGHDHSHHGHHHDHGHDHDHDHGHDHSHDHEEKTKPASSDAGSNVLTLTTETFDKIVESQKPILVEFYAPWCGHCQALVPVYEEVATALKGKIALAKVDATVEPGLGEQYNVEGYPTLILFTNEGQIIYTGDRSAEDLKSWLLKKTGPSTVTLTTDKEVQDFLAQKLTSVFFGSDPENVATFRKIAAAVQEIQFGEVANEDVVKEFGADHNTIQIHSSEGKTAKLKVDSSVTFNDISSWIEFEAYPLVREINGDLFNRFLSVGASFGIVFLNEADTAKYDPLMNSWAETLRGLVHLTWASNQLFGSVIPRFGGTGKVVPTIIAFGPNKKALSWDESKEITSEEVISWLKDVQAGKAKGFKKSEPVPASNDGPVTIVVGTTYEQIVLDSSKDVLLEVYATWCGHCQQLAPVYDVLGTAFKKFDHVVIAKVEGTENALPDDLEVEGFPTILFFPANDKKTPIVYDGLRTLKDMAAFVQEHSSQPIDLDVSVLGDLSAEPEEGEGGEGGEEVEFAYETIEEGDETEDQGESIDEELETVEIPITEEVVKDEL